MSNVIVKRYQIRFRLHGAANSIPLDSPAGLKGQSSKRKARKVSDYLFTFTAQVCRAKILQMKFSIVSPEWKSNLSALASDALVSWWGLLTSTCQVGRLARRPGGSPRAKCWRREWYGGP